MDFFAFIAGIIKDIPALIIILGLLFFVISFVKITGKIEISDPEDCKKCRAIGAIFLLIGILFIAYPDTVTVHGQITYGKGVIGKSPAPATGVSVEIGNFRMTTDSNGKYIFNNVNRSENFIKICFPKYELKESLSIPIYSIFSYNKCIEGGLVRCTIEGSIIDELGKEDIKDIQIYYNDKSATMKSGDYSVNCLIDPKYPNRLTFKSTVNPKTKVISHYQSKEIKLSDIEVTQGYKKYDILLNQNKSVDVFGTVIMYNSQNNQFSDVSYAEIEMGGRMNTTDKKGNYLITKVPRDTTIEYVTLINGKNMSCRIKPPLDYALPSEKKVKRDLIICKNN
jgi:hypothetical protein